LEARETFDEVADLYAQVRRGYPVALFADLAALAGLGCSSRVLEVGCGSGQATGDLAARAAHVTAIDPGERLIAQARRAISATNVEFVVAGFEDAVLDPASFNLIASAQAWHWVNAEAGHPKAADLLVPGGTLAIFGHVPMAVEEPFATAFKRAFDRHAPGVWGAPSPMAAYLPSGPFPAMIAASGRFEPALHRSYEWIWDLDPETFGRYLRTDSAYHFLAEAKRFALFDDLAAAVAENGGMIRFPWQTHLHLARRR
jgi:SAM-dependent methyltransferase